MSCQACISWDFSFKLLKPKYSIFHKKSQVDETRTYIFDGFPTEWHVISISDLLYGSKQKDDRKQAKNLNIISSFFQLLYFS